MTNILIADGHTLFREAVAELLRSKSRSYNVIGVDSLSSITREISIPMPDLLVVSTDVEDFETLAQTSFSTNIGTCLLVQADSAVKSSYLGFSSFIIDKNTPGRIIVKSLEEIIERGFSKSMEWHQNAFQKENLLSPSDYGLTPREGEVLFHLSQGLSNKEISRKLGIQVVTTKLHVRCICKKMRAKNRTQAAILAQNIKWNSK